ncbi:methyl-accepting chemotaxis protein [Ostreiculturibacter nitratireducens]|uniref:methyl-accepting chemotaxis protein n=1 Tax=Ostreiculturibacter nitratireducens TaxID=3075226 RepID=UPI0031B64270
MPPVSETLSQARSRAARLITHASWASLPVIGTSAWYAGGPLTIALAISLAFAVLGEIGFRQGGRIQRTMAVQSIVGQPIALVAAFAGHPWQMDMHMAFFAALSAAVAVTGVQALVVGTLMIALHHLSLTVLAPWLVYPSPDLMGNVQRTLIHALAVLIEAGVLYSAIRSRLAMDRDGMAAQARIAAALASAEEARNATAAALREAEAARAQAESETERAMAADKAARALEEEGAARRREMMETLEREFSALVEKGVSGDLTGRITASFGDPVLTRLAESLNTFFAELENVIDGVAEHMAALARGEIGSTLSRPRRGRFEELRISVNRTAAEQRRVIEAIQRSIGNSLDAAVRIERTAGAVARQSETAAAALRQTASTVSGLSQVVATNTRLIRGAERSVTEMSDRSRFGTEKVESAIAAVHAIEDSSRKISQISEMIDTLAFQTNLLALNSGVEAARAGEAGKGFSVVASEVRNLAQRSTEAARNIARLIEESTRSVTNGVRMVGETGEVLAAIADAMGTFSADVGAVAHSGREQEAGIQEVNRAIAQMERFAVDQAREADKALVSAQAVKEEIASLSEIVARYSAAPVPVPQGPGPRRNAA